MKLFILLALMQTVHAEVIQVTDAKYAFNIMQPISVEIPEVKKADCILTNEMNGMDAKDAALKCFNVKNEESEL